MENHKGDREHLGRYCLFAFDTDEVQDVAQPDVGRKCRRGMENRGRNEKQRIVGEGAARKNAPDAVLEAKYNHPVGKVQEILVYFFAFVQYDSKLILENQQDERTGKS